jgi:hypothetical protein
MENLPCPEDFSVYIYKLPFANPKGENIFRRSLPVWITVFQLHISGAQKVKY